jgi:hypothetical protein
MSDLQVHKGTQMYYSSLKCPGKRIPSRFPKRAPIRGRHAHRAFAYLSKTSSFRFQSKGALPEAPSTEPLERAIPHPKSPFIQLSKSPVNEPSSRFPRSGAAMKRDARPQRLF